jgi:hypothetical protein
MIQPTPLPDKRARFQPPLQPMGWPSGAHWNAANQAKQEAERQRRRADLLASRNRHLTAWASAVTAVLGTVALVALALGLVLGYAVGVGLIGLVGVTR